MNRSFDFNHIYSGFMDYYCKGKPYCEAGEKEYYSWVKDIGADESKEYAYCLESFSFTKDKIKFYKEDKDNKYYEILVGFPWKSMNGNVYKESDLVKDTKTLVGIHPSLNHKDEFWFSPDNPLNKWGVLTVEDANYEDGAVEAILKVPKDAVCPICDGAKMTELIETKKIVNVSLEGGCKNFDNATGVCDGFFFDEQKGFTLLTSNVLPGVPMARIFPLEHIMKEALGRGAKTRIKSIGGKKKKLKIKTIMTEEEVSPDDTGTCPEGYEKNEAGDCVKIPVEQVEDPNDPVVPKQIMPDENGQCPEGMRFSSLQGFCVPDTTCPEGQHWDEATAMCIADLNEKPEGTDVLVGTLPAGDTSKKPLTSETLCPEDHHWDGEACVKNTPSGTEVTVGPVIPDDSKKPVETLMMEVSELNYKALKDEAEKLSLKGKVVFYEKHIADLTKTLMELQAETKNTKTDKDKLEKKLDAHMKESIDKEKLNHQKVYDLDRSLADRNQKVFDLEHKLTERTHDLEKLSADKNKVLLEVAESRDNYKLMVEETKTSYEKLDKKYQENLQRNLDLMRKVTQVNEDYVALSKVKDELQERFNKVRRLAKIQVKS